VVEELLSKQQLQHRVTELAGEIEQFYGERPLTIIGVLTGSIVLLADLIRHLSIPLRVGVVQASSYRGQSTTRGELFINLDMMPDIKDRDVLLVDDILDTGHTLSQVIGHMKKLGARSVRTVVLLRKTDRLEVDITADHVGFDIPNKFVVGYGLDYQDEFRNLPFVATLDPENLPGEGA